MELFPAEFLQRRCAMRMRIMLSWSDKAIPVVIILIVGSLAAHGQSQADVSLRDDIRALQKQVSEMKSSMAEMRAEMLRARAEANELRQALQETRGALASSPVVESETGTLQKFEEEQQLLNAKVEEQHQTKVE